MFVAADDDDDADDSKKILLKSPNIYFSFAPHPFHPGFLPPGGFAISGYGSSTHRFTGNFPQATVQAMGRTGYRCFLESPEASSKLGRLEPVRLELGVSGWYGGWLGSGWGGWHRLTKKQRMCC